MSAAETHSPVSAAKAGGSDRQQDEEDPQQPKPRQPAAILDSIKKLLRLGRGSSSLRDNLADELARETGGDETFSPEERLLLGNILRLRELRVDDVMIPRADIDAVELGTSLSRVMELFQESGHSRMPVFDDTLDDPRGMVHIKDLMAHIAEKGICTEAETMDGEEDFPADEGDAPVDHDDEEDESSAARPGHNASHLDLSTVDLSITLAETDLVRNLLFVPPSMPATDLMAKMQAGRIQMALVIDEYGGTDGLVSLEDLVEEVVGDIEDEHDEEEEDMLIAAGDRDWVADPRLPLEDLDEVLGTTLSNGEITEDVDTLGGLLYVSVGRVPVRGELLFVSDVPGYEFEILDADPRRIKRLRIRRRRPDPKALDSRRRPKRSDESDPSEAKAEQQKKSDLARI